MDIIEISVVFFRWWLLIRRHINLPNKVLNQEECSVCVQQILTSHSYNLGYFNTFASRNKTEGDDKSSHRTFMSALSSYDSSSRLWCWLKYVDSDEAHLDGINLLQPQQHYTFAADPPSWNNWHLLARMAPPLVESSLKRLCEIQYPQKSSKHTCDPAHSCWRRKNIPSINTDVSFFLVIGNGSFAAFSASVNLLLCWLGLLWQWVNMTEIFLFVALEQDFFHFFTW